MGHCVFHILGSEINGFICNIQDRMTTWMGPTPSWNRGSVFKTTQFLRQDVIMKILGRAERWDGCCWCCFTLGGQSLVSDISQVLHVAAYNYPSCSFVCRLNTIIETQHQGDSWIQTGSGDIKTLSVRGRGNWIFVPQQCSVYHSRVLGRGRGWENMFLFTSSSSGEQRAPQEGNLRKASFKQTSRNNFFPLSELSMQSVVWQGIQFLK